MPINANELKRLPTIAEVESDVSEFVALLDACVQSRGRLDADARARLRRCLEDVQTAAGGALAMLP